MTYELDRLRGEHVLSKANPFFANTRDPSSFALYIPSIQTPYAHGIVKEQSIREARQTIPAVLDRGTFDFTDECSGLFFYPLVLWSLGSFSGIGDDDVQSEFIRDRREHFSDPSQHQFPMCEAYRLADSGGLQLARGVWEFDVANASNEEKCQLFGRVLRKLEKNSDMAIVLDFPTEGVLKGTIGSAKECADFQAEGMSYFEEHRDLRAQVRFLNVLQGDTQDDREYHYEVTKSYDFTSGVCISFRAYDKDFSWIIYWIWRMLKDGYLAPGGRFHVHFLGVGHLRAAIAFTRIQQAVRRHWDFPDFTISFDSSTPFLLAGRYSKAVGEAVVSRNEIRLPVFGPIDAPHHLGSHQGFPHQSGPLQSQTDFSDYCLSARSTGEGTTTFDTLSHLMLMAGNVYATIKAVHSLNLRSNAAVNNPDLGLEIPRRVHDFDAAVNKAFNTRNENEMRKMIGHNYETISYFGGRSFRLNVEKTIGEFDASCMDVQE